MHLYYSTLVSQKIGLRNHKKENHLCRMAPSCLVIKGEDDDLIQPRKPTNPVVDSPQHKELHRELLFSHKWGLLPQEKPELHRVLEQRQRKQNKKREQALEPPTDLQQELSKRQQRLLEYELEELIRREEQENVPEFVRVKGNLKHIQISGQ